MKNNIIVELIISLAIFIMPNYILSQNHLDVLGDAWVKGKLEINTNAANKGEYIWNPNGNDLRFFTGFIERLRINNSLSGGDIMIFQMDTISSVQDYTSGNVVRLSDGTLALRQYSVGDLAHGGMVLWIDETGEHGLVASLNDIEFTTGDFNHNYSTVPEFTGASGDGIASGNMNTVLIVSAQRGDEDSAARLCADLVEGGYGDWYLPSKSELNLMWNNLADSDGNGINIGPTDIGNIGGFSNSFYWSSSEIIQTNAWSQDFEDGDQNNVPKNFSSRVRAIRAF